MAHYYALYNPLSCNGNGEQNAYKLKEIYQDDSITFKNLIDIKNLGEYLNTLSGNDTIILCGGDGTVNQFINNTLGVTIKNAILYFPIGTGNDFALDLGYPRESTPFPINDYINNLPSVTVNGKTHRFINGIGYGIDGYCCEIGDQMKNQNKQNINYASIAVSGLLFHYRPTDATVIVDGAKHTYKNVWLAPTMNGRFYGGGMMPTPAQKRNSGKLSVMVFHGSGKIKTLMIFPSIFKGKHIEHKENVEVIEGNEIKVEFSRPTPLQIDGETVLNVISYSTNAG